ncbi:MAG: replication initiator protein [Microvirus sp.]|nr:MAG: replication initiator protein [Microvirus sp.]
MSCFHPAKAFLLASGGISFVERGDIIRDIEVPCGRCIGCRLDRARDWTTRLIHEASLHKPNWFATLTYDDQHLPNPPSLDYRDYQLFMKRARKHYGPFRFFMCGEYGDQTRRPHYHAILFGLPLDDLARWGGKDTAPTFTSPTLTKIWGKGMIVLGQVNPQTAGYVARYNLKKVNGDRAEAHYRWVDPETGDSHQLVPEFCNMSRKPGIGADWYKKFHGDCHNHDFIIRDGSKTPVPRYYDKLGERSGLYEVDVIKQARTVRAKLKQSDNTPERLKARETVAKARSKLSTRNL